METTETSEESLSKIIYAVEKGEYGHIVCIVKHFYPKRYKNNYKQILDHMVLICAEALRISNKYNHKTIFVHIYLNGCSTNNFSLTLAKQMTDKLYSTFADTLEKGYVYSKSRLFGIIMQLLGNVLASDTAEKFKHVRS
tara:strand:- start:1798 stop:2214 length:417 start_codon:yes stop_codon:yes gene_type:complete